MPKKILPHLANRRQWVYTAYSMHYNWSVVVLANTIQEARVKGSREAKQVFGNHAVIHRDTVIELSN